ncbi:MAG: helix-turn-helix domain-containing protein [Thermoplasmata archaeon]|nr:helix-turn-helix domain-containing protein [Candidatus Sysuiplasma acidicola]
MSRGGGGNILEAEVWHVFRELREEGMSVSEIARQSGVSRPTVRKYIASGMTCLLLIRTVRVWSPEERGRTSLDPLSFIILPPYQLTFQQIS